jgi:hypothetical protein
MAEDNHKTQPPSKEEAPAPPTEGDPVGEEQAAPSDDPPGKTAIDGDEIDRAVDDIVAKEGDEVLAAEDAAHAQQAPVRHRRGFWRGLGHIFALWLGTTKGRWLTFGLLVIGAGAVTVVQPARYYALNTIGVRASATAVVTDDLTQLPLAGVPVSLAGRQLQTDATGKARFTSLRLGPARLTIDRVGFARLERRVIIGWGSNPLGSFGLQATGARYTITVHDYLSGKPVSGVLATSGLASALSDQNGTIQLTLQDASAAQSPITISKDGYRSGQVTLKNTGQPTDVLLVGTRQAVFVAKQDGKYDLFKSDIDGANRTLLLPGTGNENANISLAVSQDGSHAALISTRDTQKDADGFALSTLSLVSVADGSTISLAHTEQVQLVTWVGSRLVFEQVSTDPNTPPANRYALVSYDYGTNSRLQLASGSKLNGVFYAQGAVYYAVAQDDALPAQHAALYRIYADGNGKQTVLDSNVWSGLRTDYNTLSLQTADGWITYNIPNGTHDTINSPASFTSRLYADNANGSQSLWVNQGVLELYDAAGGKDRTVQSQPGLNYPLYWLGDDSVVFRVVSGNETADYAASLLGGTPHKITDVVNTYGFAQSQ